MKIIGWIGTILFAPFYFLYHAIDKLKMVYWLPAGAGAYGPVSYTHLTIF